MVFLLFCCKQPLFSNNMRVGSNKYRKRNFITSLVYVGYHIPTIIRLGKKAKLPLTYNMVKQWRNRHLAGQGITDSPCMGRPKTTISPTMAKALKKQAHN